MPQLVKKRRSGWAVLAAGALVASLLAVGSAPAGAAEIKTGEDNKAEQSAKPTFSACVGEALDDHGFTDLGTLEAAVPNINCLAYYGISAGKTADTFDPNTNVTRGQMALFLYAAAGLGGADLMGGTMSADFGDVSELGENRQNAIKALARNGIMAGRGGMAFEPHADITRAEMAVALVELVRHTAPGRFVAAGTDKGKLAGADGAALAADAIDHFADSRAGVPRSVDTAISYAYELGITSGVGDGTSFDPSGTVPRRNMATFIMNALAHSNLRPAGLTVQSDNGQLTASLRDADFKPVANELVDAFYVDASREDRALNNDGKCRSIVKAVDGSTTSTCEVHVLDAATDADGNAALNGLAADQIGKGVTVWVWTGDAGDKVDDGTDFVRFEQGPVTNPTAATKITVSPSQTMTPTARFGTAVQFTGQLQHVDGGLDKDTSVGTDPAAGGAEYSLVVAVYTGIADAGTFAVADATGVVTIQDAGAAALGLVSRSAPETLKTDADGKLTFSLSTGDPNPSATSTDDARTVVYVLTPGKNAPGAAAEGGDPTLSSGYVLFGEAASKVTTVKVESIGSYAEVPASANSPASHGVTVTVLDQYGRPMRNQAVTLTSSDATSALPGVRRTGSAGSVRIFFSHPGTTAGTETITATWDAGPGPDGAVGSGDDPPDVTGEAAVVWATRTEEAAQATGQTVVAANLDEDEVVVTPDAPALLRYDANDIFRTVVPAPTTATPDATRTSYVEVEAFEALLATVIDPANQALAAEAEGKRTAVLEWDAYDHDDEDGRTLFTFTLTIVSS